MRFSQGTLCTILGKLLLQIKKRNSPREKKKEKTGEKVSATKVQLSLTSLGLSRQEPEKHHPTAARPRAATFWSWKRRCHHARQSPGASGGRSGVAPAGLCTRSCTLTRPGPALLSPLSALPPWWLHGEQPGPGTGTQRGTAAALTPSPFAVLSAARSTTHPGALCFSS